jgi:hypothetical protein
MASDCTWETKYRQIVVKIKDGTTITGNLNIGNFTRVSDFFKKSDDKFLVLSEAESRGASGKIVIINKSEILWAEPSEEGSGDGC